MNIFALSYNVQECAIWHMDKHIVKMPLETAQMLCTVLNKLGISTPYKPVHAKHPCTLWTGINQSNFRWLSNLGLELCKEYSFRYQKEHACHKVIIECISSINIPLDIWLIVKGSSTILMLILYGSIIYFTRF